MIEEINREGEHRRFFGHLPAYEIDHHNETIEVVWVEPGDGRNLRSLRVDDLDEAAWTALAIGPDRDTSILVRERPDGLARAVGRTALLAVWRYRERRPGDSYLLSDLDHVAFVYSEEWRCRVVVRQFPAGAGTCEAISFRYPFRPCRPVRHPRTEARPERDS